MRNIIRRVFLEMEEVKDDHYKSQPRNHGVKVMKAYFSKVLLSFTFYIVLYVRDMSTKMIHRPLKEKFFDLIYLI